MMPAVAFAVACSDRIGHNSPMRWRWLAVVALIPLGAGRPSTELSAGSDGDGHALILKALDRVTRNEEQDFASRSRVRMTKNVRRFDEHGEVTEEDHGDYEVVPIEGVPFERRLTVNDRPLSDEERGWEDEREAEFREELRRSREGGDEPEREEEDIVFNEELVARYTFTLEGEEQLRNRASYRVSFRPRAGHLPVRRRIDHALNKARGTVWIDRETHEAARIEFELIDKVRLWWGLLGTLSRARGSLDRGPVLDETWAMIQFETYTDTRVVFKPTRRAELRQWRDFEWVEAP